MRAPREQRTGNLPAVERACEPDVRSDIMSPAKRSALMSRIRGRDTGPEMTVRRLLHAMGYRFRLHARDLPGKPDVVFRRRRVALFVHGCFWHRHDCGLAYVPKTRADFWQRKFAGNVARDQRTKQELEVAGWRVVAVWECELGDLASLAGRFAKELGPPRTLGRNDSLAKVRRWARRTRVQAKPSPR